MKYKLGRRFTTAEEVKTIPPGTIIYLKTLDSTFLLVLDKVDDEKISGSDLGHENPVYETNLDDYVAILLAGNARNKGKSSKFYHEYLPTRELYEVVPNHCIFVGII